MTATVTLAVITAALFGSSDFLGGLASRRDVAMAVTARSHTLGVLMFAIAVAVWPAAGFAQRDVFAGVMAGAAGGFGVVSLYGALSLGRMSVVAPITAALSGSLPAVYDLLRGTRVGPLAWAGLALAVVAVVIVSTETSPDEGRGMPPKATLLAVLAGLGFATSFISFSLAGKTSGLWPLLFSRITSAVVLSALTLATRRTLSLARDARGLALGAGFLEASANVTMISAIRIGPLAVASVLGSLYPVVTILLARVVLQERVRPRQRFGIGLALAAVVLTAVR
jgi:drug/metabolite transporter (DMT)-like permease